MSIGLERMNRENEHPEIQMIKAKFVCDWAEMRENIFILKRMRCDVFLIHPMYLRYTRSLEAKRRQHKNFDFLVCHAQGTTAGRSDDTTLKSISRDTSINNTCDHLAERGRKNHIQFKRMDLDAYSVKI